MPDVPTPEPSEPAPAVLPTGGHDPATEGHASGVAAVIVTYFPEVEDLPQLIAAVSAQVERVLVIDNTPAEHASRLLAGLADDRCEVRLNGRNVGLAAAQNAGVVRARALGMRFVLFMDQDSAPAPDMVVRLLAALADLSARGEPVAAVGPRWVDRRTGEEAAFVRYGWGWADQTFCSACGGGLVHTESLVSSGTLVPIGAFDVVGLMDAGLFIDQVDTEWGLRAAQRGLKLFGVCDAVLRHGIGEDFRRVWFLRWRKASVHNPVRDYYLVRNILTVYFRRPAFWRWRVFYAFMLVGLCVTMVTQMPNRLARAWMIALGIRDALAGRLGAFELAGRTHAEATSPVVVRPTGLWALWRRFRRVAGRQARRLVPRRSRVASPALVRLRHQHGIEIGGYNLVFERHGLLPVYAVVSRVDNIRVPSSGEAAVDQHVFPSDRRTVIGSQLDCEPTALTPLADRSVGFVLATHVLEHCANPLKALREWYRVLSPDGTLLLVLPHKAGTFDHQRPATTLAHMIADFEADVGEDDMTHLPEVLALHDLSRDRPAGTRDAFRSRCLRNAENRLMHHHVFETRTVLELVDHAGYELLAVDTVAPMHVVVMAARPTPGSLFSNARFLARDAEWRRLSAFPSDRRETDPVADGHAGGPQAGHSAPAGTAPEA